MNKSDLVEALADKLELPNREAKAVLNTILDIMADTLERGESIQIRGFGSFQIKQYDSYEGRNPSTGEKTIVKPKKLPIFKVGKDLRERVNEPYKK